jgi:hypothetical protein
VKGERGGVGELRSGGSGGGLQGEGEGACDLQSVATHGVNKAQKIQFLVLHQSLFMVLLPFHKVSFSLV